MTKILVIAKAPVPGRVKTRLCPPCAPSDAAAIARAALVDTLHTVAGVEGAEPIVVLDGVAGDWLPEGMPFVAQRGPGLAERIEAAFAEADGPALLIGMDTPQVTADVLQLGLDALASPGIDAVLGEATDGGWWIAGLRTALDRTFAGVPMSTAFTARAQRARFRELGLRTAELPRLQDVDSFADAIAVAREVPGSSFAAAVSSVARRLAVDEDVRAAETA
jgi:uncharacterized protein